MDAPAQASSMPGMPDLWSSRLRADWTGVAAFALFGLACGSTPSPATKLAEPDLAASTVSPADVVLRNAKVVTVDDAFSLQQAVAVTGNKIVYVGSDVGVTDFVGPHTQVEDLAGAFVMPGMTDSHCHPFGLGTQGDPDDSFSVAGSTSWAEVVAKVAAKVDALEPGQWVIGGGWSEEDFDDRKVPVHDALSQVSPENPVFLYRRGGNSAFVNQRALEIAGITKDTPDPYGGKIGRKSDGSPSGFLVNMGNNLVHKHFPRPNKPDEWYRERYQIAARRSNEVGLTGWHDAGTEPDHIRIYKQLVDRGELNVRANVMLQNPRLGYDDTVEYFRQHRVVNYGGEDMLQVRSVKMFFDGALGSRGAAFFEPYHDDPGNRGVTEVPPEHVYDVARAGLEAGMQICPHAIGIRGNAEYLDAVAKALADKPVKDHRFRSEHAEVVRPEDVQRFAELGVIASVQPIHCTSDMSFLEDRIGPERCHRSASPWRGFLDAGVVVASGSDFTVESHRPLWGIFAAVTRTDHDGKPAGGWYGDQRMTMEEAIRSYTWAPAYAAFMEDRLGSLEVGKLADIVVLDHDLLTIAPAEILETEVLLTIVNGKIVYRRS